MPDVTFGFEVPFGALGATVFAIAFAALFAWSIRSLRDHPKRRLFLAFRAATLVLGFCVATQPSCSRERNERTPGRLAVVVDGSRSMGVGRGDDERLARAKRLVARWSGESVARRASVYVVSSDARPSDFESIRRLEADGEESRLVDSIQALVREDSREEIGAIVLVSDGADTAVPRLDRVDLGGVRVHTVAVADERRDRDDAIIAVRPDARAYLRTPYRITADIRATALAGNTIPVTLQRAGMTLETKSVTLDSEGLATVEFQVMPERVGRVFHRLVIPTDASDVVPENNGRSVLVRVGRERLRVLLVAGHPTWDVRYLRSFLERDPTNDLISFFILRTETDMLMADPSEMSLIPFPTDELFRQHLASFDLVVFQDFDYGPYRMAAYLPLIAHYVEQGGSFAMVGGEKSLASGGYVGTPIERMLPVTMPGGAGSSVISVDRFRPELVDSTELHPIVALAPSRDDNRAFFGRLAPSIGANLLTGVRDGAVALLVHPTLRDAHGGKMPILAVSEHGRGRVLALAIDSSYRWGLATAATTGDGSGFERFWDRAVRWLARDPALEPSQVITDRERYGLGARIRVEVLARRPSYEPLAGERVRVAVVDEAGTTTHHEEIALDAEGRAVVSIDGPVRVGVFRIIASLVSDDSQLAEEAFVVEASGDELADPRPRPELLRRLAELTEGRFIASADSAPRLSSFDLTRERSLGLVTDQPFRSPFAIGALLALLGAEWVVRRRLGLR